MTKTPSGNWQADLERLSAAEEFLEFFGINYDQNVVHVHRLHILKRLHQYLRREPEIALLDEEKSYARHRELLQKAHDDFVASTAAQEKVFRVFQDAEAKSFALERLRGTLTARG